jgi:hypothetical protein
MFSALLSTADMRWHHRHDRFVPTSDLCMQQPQFRALAAGEIKEARTGPHSLGKSSTITTRVMLSAAFFADI